MSDPKIRYAILCGSRTGSTYLCDLLESTNRLGTPNEYFNPSIIHKFYNEFKPNDFWDYVNKLYWNTKKDNDCMGAKIISDGWKQMEFAQAFGYLDQVTHWIYLNREDKVLQAISRYKAWHSGNWQYKKERPVLKYSRGDIKFTLNHIIENDARDQEFLEGKNFTEITYEGDLLEEPNQTVFHILNFLGLPTTGLPKLETSRVIQRNEQSLEWREKFLAGE